MKKLTKLILAASFLAFASTANAIPITGSINFYANYTHNGTTDLSDATQISISSATVAGATDSFLDAGIVGGDSASYSSFTFSPTGAVDSLWKIGIFEFDLTSMVNEYQTENMLVLSGSGILSAAGFEDTHADWGFTANPFGYSLTWSKTDDVSYQDSSVSVPEPSIALLIGAGLLGISFSRKMRKAA